MSILSLLDNSILSLLTIKLTLYKSNTLANKLALSISVSVLLSFKHLKRELEKCHLKLD